MFISTDIHTHDSVLSARFDMFMFQSFIAVIIIIFLLKYLKRTKDCLWLKQSWIISINECKFTQFLAPGTGQDKPGYVHPGQT